ncbi:MAG TPA: hypothetical protein VGG23_01430 [Acidimicrobiales bacterium]
MARAGGDAAVVPASATAVPGAPDRRRPGRPSLALPHRWAILAVALAAMSLVAALTSTSQSPRSGTTSAPPMAGGRPVQAGQPAADTAGRGGHAGHSDQGDAPLGAGGATDRSPAPGAGPSDAEPGPLGLGGAPGTPTGAFGHSSSASVASSGTPVGATVEASSSSSTAGSTAGSVGGSAGPGAGPTSPATTPTPSDAPDPTVQPGNLQYPDDVSASYPFEAGAAAVEATVSWTTGTPLTLTIACGGQTQQVSGTAALSTSADFGPGSCLVTVAEAAPGGGPVAYTLTISSQPT